MALLFLSDKYEALYNCSFYNYEEKFPYKDRSNPFFGWLYLFTAVTIWILYIPCIIVMSKKDFIKYPCYKLMVFLGILDLHTSLYTGYWTAIIDINGNVYCSWPTAGFIVGCLHAAAWKAQTTATVLLALNRCMESFNKYYAEILFNGKRIYFWMGIPILWGLQDIVGGPPIIFNSIFSILTYNPHEGYVDDVGNKYNDRIIFAHNIFIAVSLIFIYGMFGLYIFFKSKAAKTNTSNAKVFSQILCISIFYLFSMAGFFVTQYVEMPTFLNPGIAFTYILLNGLPAIIYLTLNKTMRKNVFGMFGLNSEKKIKNITRSWTFYNYEEKLYKDRSNPFFGWLYLFTAVTIWILYIPCIIVMSKKDFIKYPCYKLMVFLGILDLHITIYVGFWSGIVNITGNVFCHWPKLAFIMGCLHGAAWTAQTTATVLLAINRCMESFNKYFAEILFNGKRVYFWMTIPILLALQNVIWGPPGIFSPVYSVLTYNPHEGYFSNEWNRYFDPIILYYNIVVAVSLVLIYGIFGILIFVKSKSAKNIGRNAKVFGQILLISLFLVMVMVFFFVTQFSHFSPSINPWITYSFLLLNGLPPIIYLTLNKTMRKNIFAMFKAK